jgi:hypothetical protein
MTERGIAPSLVDFLSGTLTTGVRRGRVGSRLLRKVLSKSGAGNGPVGGGESERAGPGTTSGLPVCAQDILGSRPGCAHCIVIA